MAKTRIISAVQHQRLNWHERRRARMGRRTEQLNLKVYPDWRAQLFDIAETERLRPVEVVEQAVELYRRVLEKAAGSPAKRKKPRLVTCTQPAP
jgi:hypothetical protein